MPDRRPPVEPATRFIAYLGKYAKDRGALAGLRCTFSETRRHRAWPLLGGFAGAIGEERYELVAALWAEAPDKRAEDRNLGAALAGLAEAHNSFEGRFKRLLTADRDEAPRLVAPLARAAQAKGISIHHARLLSDLLCWGDYVKVEWAKAFWGAATPEEAA
jgi:CRISPR type I-E-associated protein CasB/Cse2